MKLDSIIFDKKIFEINQLHSHSSMKTYMSKKSFFDGSESKISLNGIRKGFYLKNLDTNIIDDILKVDDISSFGDVEVPLSLSLQGYDFNQYANTQFQFDGYFNGSIGEEITIENPCMIYFKDINISDLNKNIIINFLGFECGLTLYCNGKFVGYSENLYLPTEFKLNDFLKLGTNRIAVVVMKYTTASWFLNQDFFRFFGIFRDVELIFRPKKYIEDIDFDYELDVSKRRALINIKIKGDLELNDLHFKLYYKDEVVLENDFLGNYYNGKLENISLWSAEVPNIYKLVIFNSFNGEIEEIVTTNIGFKKVEIIAKTLYFNDKRLKINGINRHEWNMNRGRNVSIDDMNFDINFLKEHNVNAIRMSHYPNHPYMYDLIDEKGFYLVDEACLETHGTFGFADGYKQEFALPGNNLDFLNYCTSKILRLYETNKNHPSIIFISLGNESGSGEVFYRISQTLKKLNKNLLIHYEGERLDENYLNIGDIKSRMYYTSEKIEQEIIFDTKPFMICEFSHAMGNSLGNFKDYMDLFDKYESYVGGFIWDYIDQGLMQKNYNGDLRLCYGGDFLDKPNDANFCCNGVIFADRKEAYKSSKANAMKYYYAPYKIEIFEDKIFVSSLYLFKNNVNALVHISILNNGNILHSVKINKQFNLNEKVIIPISLEIYPKEDLIVQVEVYEDSELKAWKEEQIFFEISKTITQHHPFDIIDGHYNIGVIGKHFSYLFSKSKISFCMPGLISIKINGEEYLSKNVLPTIFRPNTDNDIGNNFAFENNALLGASKNIYCGYELMDYKIKTNSLSISYKYILSKKTNDYILINYEIMDDGSIDVEEILPKLNLCDEIGVLAIRFALPRSIKNISYFGKGPFENYVDRNENCLTKIYKTTSTNEYVNYIKPQECGNHLNTRRVKLHGDKSTLTFEFIDLPFAFKFLENDEFEIENANHVFEIPHSNNNYLYIEGFTRGVGGDDSRGAIVKPQYALKVNKEYKFKFKIRPY